MKIRKDGHCFRKKITTKGDVGEPGEAVRYYDQMEGVINFLIAFLL